MPPLIRDEDPTQVVKGSGNSESLSVVLPIFEEAETVTELITEIVESLSSGGRPFEIVAVDDGSQDETPQVLGNLRKRFPEQLHVVTHLYNKGNGAALRTGSRVAEGDIVVFMDADGQHSAENILKLVGWIPPYDLVIGARGRKSQGSFWRQVANSVFNRFASWLSRTKVEDLTSGFRAMRRQALNHFISLFPSGFSTPTTITLAFIKAGYNVGYLPIEVGKRVSGKSKIRPWSDGTRFIIIILRMIMLYDPLRIFLPVSVVLLFLGILAWIAGLVQAARLVVPNSAIFLFIAALLTGLLGLVSGQIASARIYYHGDETIVVDDEPRVNSTPEM